MTAETTQQPFISVIIPTFNDNQRLKICLDALANQSYPISYIEVIIVDNGSDKPPFELVTDYANVQLLEESKVGSYAARNTGIDNAKGDILAFIDSDCIPLSDWIEQGVKHLTEVNVPTVIGGEVDIFYEIDNQPTAIELYEKLFAFPIKRNIRDNHYPPSGNMFVPKSVLEIVGKFNENLKSGGDIDWGNRAYNKGINIQYSRQITVLHPARRTFTQYANKVRRVAGGQVKRSRLDDQKPFFLNRIFYYDFLPPLGATKSLLKDQRFTASQKLRIFGVVLWIRTVAIREKIAVLTGFKQPER